MKQRSVTLPTFINSAEGIAAAGRQLLQGELPITIRLLGLRVSTLQQASHALPGSLEGFLRKGLQAGAVSNRLHLGDSRPQEVAGITRDIATSGKLCREDVEMRSGSGGTCSVTSHQDGVGAAAVDHEQGSGCPPLQSDGSAGQVEVKVCPECGARIPAGAEALQEHLDMHLAQRLSATVNGAGYIQAKAPHRSVGTVDKGQTTQQKSGAKRGPESESKKKQKAARPCTPGALDRLLKK